jgi:TetR/AcrR family transcriptional repressor of nem operon
MDISKASLHYHFAGKAELGEALIVRYTERFNDALAAIDGRDLDARAKLAAYVDLYAEVLRGQRMCLCGILAAEYQTLPDAMRDAVIRFFDANETWLTRVLEQGQAEGTLSLCETAGQAAQMIVSGLEGAMLVARPFSNPDRFESAAHRLLTSLTT